MGRLTPSFRTVYAEVLEDLRQEIRGCFVDLSQSIEEQEDNEEEEEREAEVSSKEMREWRRSVANKNKVKYYVESDEIDSDELDNF